MCSTHEEEHNIITTQLIPEMYEKDPKIAEKIFSKDCIHQVNGVTEPGKGPDQIITSISEINKQFADSKVTILDFLAQDNKVAFRWSWTAINKLSNMKWTYNGNTIFHFNQGRVTEAWAIDDRIREIQQQGFTITPPQS